MKRPVDNSPRREKSWASALRAAAEVARRATVSEADVIRAVTEELRRLELRGGVLLMTEEDQLQIQSRSLSQVLERSLQRLTGYEITGYRFNPKDVDVYRRALESGEAVFSDDRAEIVTQMIPPLLKPLLPSIMRILGESNVIVAPLVLAQETIGTINVTAKWLSPEDLPMVAALADHIAIALGHVRARAELESALQLQSLRSQIAEAATSALDLPVVLERIVLMAVSELGADAGAVGIIDDEKDTIDFPFSSGVPEHFLTQTTMDEGNLAVVLQSHQPLLMNHYQRSPGAADDGLQSNPQALLAAPLLAEGKSIGFIGMFSYTKGFEFTRNHLEMLEAVASIASTAVQNARLYARANRRAEESQALIRTARAISSSLDADTVLQEIAQQANILLQTDGSRIHMLDQDAGVLRCVVASGPNAKAIMAVQIPIGEGLTGYVVETGEPLLLNDPVPDKRGIQVPGTPEDELECLAIVPLSIRQRTMGAMAVRRLGHLHPFTQNDLELLMALAAQAAVSIENAHLYGQIESQAQQLEQQVTARTRDLALSESRYRSLVESAQFGIFQLNPQGKIVYANQALADLAGMPLEELLGKNFGETPVVPQEFLNSLNQRFKDRLQGKRPPQEIYEFTFRSTDHKPIPTIVGVSVFTDEDGKPEGLTGVVTDISERIELEQALRAERDRLNTLLNNIGDAVMVTDTKSKILFVN
ncbi:MAG: GAF domain-containing protein, partial [Anaerolineales bacterium]